MYFIDLYTAMEEECADGDGIGGFEKRITVDDPFYKSGFTKQECIDFVRGMYHSSVPNADKPYANGATIGRACNTDS